MTYGILKKPVISEKATFLSERGTYVFFVHLNANKIMITEAIRARFGVKPHSVRIVNIMPKRIRRGVVRGWTEARKKAFVTLPPGQKIELA